MELFWNRKDLTSPPINTAKTKITSNELRDLSNNVATTYRKFENTEYLNKEAALLSRVIYRMKYKFRNDKGFKSMEKVNRAILQYLNMNFQQDLSMFHNTIDGTQSDFNFDLYLPTKQMLQYLLVRCQGFAKLMARIIISCEITAYYMNERLRLGHSWTLALLTFSIISRIRSIAIHMLREICLFYDKMLPFLNILKLSGLNWLPDDYVFPINIFAWLELESLTVEDLLSKNLIDFTNQKEEYSIENIKTLDLGVQISREQFDLMCSEKKENKTKQDKNMKIDADTNDNKKKVINIKNIKVDSNKNDEHTSKISLNVKSNKGGETEKNHSITAIHNVETLEKFMKKEDKYRKMGSVKSISKHLDLYQWKLLQKLVGKFMKKMILANENEKQVKKLIVKTKRILSNNIEM